MAAKTKRLSIRLPMEEIEMIKFICREVPTTTRSEVINILVALYVWQEQKNSAKESP